LQISSKRVALAFVSIGIISILIFAYHVRLQKAETNTVVQAHLRIPKINVDTEIESVGLLHKGEMDVPKDISHAAWFNLGPKPGEKGSAVIDGHYGWKDGISAVFDNLSKLKRGDKIYIENEKGITLTFIVRETKIFGENEDASVVFSSNDGGSHLNLITCGGAWSKTVKSYSDRVVVFADRV
jgi:sortase A